MSDHITDAELAELEAEHERDEARAEIARLSAVVETIEDFIAHMDAIDRGRIAGREVAQHLRAALTTTEEER